MKFVIVYGGKAYGPYDFDSGLEAHKWVQGSNIAQDQYSIYPLLEPKVKGE